VNTAALKEKALQIVIAGIPVRVLTQDAAYQNTLEELYAGFIDATAKAPTLDLQIELEPASAIAAPEDKNGTELGPVSVRLAEGRWRIEREDVTAEWDPISRRAWVRQTASPFSTDCVLRIVHSFLAASEGGFLLHSASAIRNGRAFLFSGASGAGKTTISRLAPLDAVLLSDEISYVKPRNDGYAAFGTPFAGDIGRSGENTSAMIAALYLIRHGIENTFEPLNSAAAVRQILQNVLFFGGDEGLANRVFESVCEFVRHVPVYHLTFSPDPSVWQEII
jgi:hypothetical protein